MVNLELDLEKLKSDMAKIYRDLDKSKIEQATYRALNHTTAKAKTSASRYSRDRMRLKIRDIKKEIKVTKARPGRLYSSLGAGQGPLRVKLFPHGQRRKGVAVGVSPGRRKLINRSFVAKMPNGSVGVFARGRYGPNGFRFDKKGDGTKGKGKITQLLTTTVPQKLDDPALLTILRKKMYVDFPTRMSYLLGRQSKYGQSPVRF